MQSPQSPDASHVLRLVGVHEDGDHLVLSSQSGREFFLPINDALRHATTRPIGRSSANAADEAAKVQLTPREIQAKIRAGASIESLAEDYDLDFDRLRTYEVPIIAERNWITQRAKEIEVLAPQPSYELYRNVFGDEPALLGEMVHHRLNILGIDPDTVTWDAWKEEESRLWTISADFSTEDTHVQIGDTPPALWSFQPQSKHIENLNRWAQTLSELEPTDHTASMRRLSPVSQDGPFDFESATSSQHETRTGSAWSQGPETTPEMDSHEELLDVLQARRGQRLGVDEESDDELALMITKDETPEWTGPKLVSSRDDDSQESSDATDAEESRRDDSREESQDDLDSDRYVGTRLHSADRNADAKADVEDAEKEFEGQTNALEDLSEEETGEAMRREEPKEKRRRRPSLPSWDEIMLGTRKDDN